MTLCSRHTRNPCANEAGITFVELLITGLLATVVLLGISSVYVSMMRYGVEVDHQADLQQQGTLLQQNLSSRILPAINLFSLACGPNPQFSLGIVYSDTTKNSCIYQQGTEIYVCRLPANFPLSTACLGTPAPTDLLQGSRATIAVNSLQFDCGDPPFCTAANRYATGGAWVDVQFGLTAATAVRPVVFATRLTLRN